VPRSRGCRPVPRVRAARPRRLPRRGARRGGAVIGEVYEVDESTLAALDRLEGRPRFHTRTHIALEDGMAVDAYLLSPEQVSSRRVILSGDWRAHRRDRAKARDFDDDTEAG
jgi:hypothetical protein